MGISVADNDKNIPMTFGIRHNKGRGDRTHMGKIGSDISMVTVRDMT